MRIVIASTKLKGTLTQCLGVAALVAERLSAQGIKASVETLTWRDRLLAKIPLVSGWGAPALVISCGSVGESRARQFLAKHRRILWAHIEVPDPARDIPDLVFVSHHDWREPFGRLAQYVKIDGVPHGIRHQEIAAARPAARERLGLADDAHAAVVLVGGPNGAFDFDVEIDRSIAAYVEKLANHGSRVFVSTSRRTAPATAAAIGGLRHPNVTVYDGRGDNPYRDYLAAADEIAISEDSLTMCCEAIATGKPVSLLRLAPMGGDKFDKFRRFQRHFINDLNLLSYVGETRPPPGQAVPDDAEYIAERIVEAIGAREGHAMGH